MNARRVWRWLGLGLGSVLLLLVLVVLAWVLSNSIDRDPVPRPPELVLAPDTLPAERNDFYALLALRSGAGTAEALRQSGRQQWVAMTQGPRTAQESPAFNPKGAPFECSAPDDCLERWMTQTPELARQIEAHPDLTRGCDHITASFQFVEVLAMPPSVQAPAAPHAVPASTCSRWISARTLVAWSAGDRDTALRLLRQADTLSRGLLAGSRSLIGQAVAWRVARRHWRVAQLVGRTDAAWATAVAGMLRPLSAGESKRGAWIPYEALFHHTAMDEVFAACADPAKPVDERPDALPLSATSPMVDWLCRHHVGLLPNQSHADIDRQWLLRLPATRSNAGLQAAIEGQREAEGIAWYAGLWRNTFARALLEVGGSFYLGYFAREVDVELHRAALALALEAVAQDVPASQRPAWFQARAQQDEVLRDRVVLDGAVLRVRTWQEAAGAATERDKIEIKL